MGADASGQYVLHPNDTTPHTPLTDERYAYLRKNYKHHVLKFGYVPDYDQLQVGDLLLVSSVRPCLVTWAIRRAQEQIPPSENHHARWQHAAVYVGGGKICEATLRGVYPDDIHNKYVGTHLLRFRRGKNVTELQGYKIAIYALLLLRLRYDWISIARLLFQATFGRDQLRRYPPSLSKRATICSKLFADAFDGSTSSELRNDDAKPMTPAALSADTQYLKDIPVDWKEIR